MVVRRGGGGELRPPAPSSRRGPHMRTLPGVGGSDDEASPLPLITHGRRELPEAFLVTPRTSTATLRPLVLARSVGGDPRRPITLLDGVHDAEAARYLAEARRIAEAWRPVEAPPGFLAKLRAFFAQVWQALAAA